MCRFAFAGYSSLSTTPSRAAILITSLTTAGSVKILRVFPCSVRSALFSLLPNNMKALLSSCCLDFHTMKKARR
ncbi:hypothetical protein HMPREF0201_04516 [Cedecea davisae DSM 4568]|uniref:Secreted protein n=1 Tax=Cedecea davisae DSM 4568 TaxID=566551 RepID=S3IGC2_9ENTR|nr:hypothetical protein HMPREF0201_04516 [Cedecea davisae DSM 4568]